MIGECSRMHERDALVEIEGPGGGRGVGATREQMSARERGPKTEW